MEKETLSIAATLIHFRSILLGANVQLWSNHNDPIQSGVWDQDISDTLGCYINNEYTSLIRWFANAPSTSYPATFTEGKNNERL